MSPARAYDVYIQELMIALVIAVDHLSRLDPVDLHVEGAELLHLLDGITVRIEELIDNTPLSARPLTNVDTGGRL